MIPRDAAKRRGFGVLDGSGDGREARMSKLRAMLPGVIAEDGRVDAAALQNSVGKEHVSDGSQRHELRFAGKGIANYLADTPTDKELKTEHGQSKNFDVTSNVVIRGDNLDVLKILRQNYFDSVKMIYIDPPYNTAKDDFTYNDYFRKSEAELIEELGLDQETIERFQDLYGTKTHSGWLSFMYPRLKIARELLTDDGVIFISIDDNEQANLRGLCDEIFGDSNFIGTLVWKTATDNNATQIATEHEYVVCYAKNKHQQGEWEIPSENAKKFKNKYAHLKRKIGNDPKKIQKALKAWIKTLDEEDRKAIGHYKFVDKNGIYCLGNSANPRPGGYDFDIVHPLTNQVCKKSKNGYRWTEKTFLEHLERDDVEWGKDHNIIPTLKKRIDTVVDHLKSVYYEDNRKTTKELTDLFNGYKVFDNPKSPRLIKRLLHFSSIKNSIILDFFAGSGTTSEAVMRLNAEDGGSRKFILVQIDEDIKQKKTEAIEFCTMNKWKPVISSITVERLNRMGDVIKKEHPDIDIGYKVFSLKPKPQIAADGAQELLLSAQHTERSASDTLSNMLCATGKPLDTPIRTVVEGTLYEAGGELYVLGAADLAGHVGRINVDGWGEDNTLEQYLNLPANDVEIVY